jgi:tRNA(Ile)-lysidine synthase
MALINLCMMAAGMFACAAAESVEALEVARLVTDWRGQGPIDLPGLTARRDGRLLVFTAAR